MVDRIHPWSKAMVLPIAALNKYPDYFALNKADLIVIKKMFWCVIK